MDFETIWLHATQISATARYIMMIDEGQRNPEPREAMVKRLGDQIESFIDGLREGEVESDGQ